MIVIHDCWHLILLLIIVIGPIPLGIACAKLDCTAVVSHQRIHRLLLGMTTWLLLQITLGLILGILNKLLLGPVIGAELVLLMVGLFLSWRKFGLPRYAVRPDLQNISRLTRTEGVILATLFFVATILLIRLVTQPLTDYDSVWFHLPAIARWSQTGSFTLLDPAGEWIFEHPTAKLYPYNWHILLLLSFLPLQTDTFVALPMFMAWGLWGLAVYGLSRHFGATRVYSLAATVWVLTIPIVLSEAKTAHVDLPLAAWFTVSLYFLITYLKAPTIFRLALFFVTLGLLASIKTPGIIYSLFLLGILVISVVRSWITVGFMRPFNVKALQAWPGLWSVPLMGGSILLCLFLGGFWYLRDLQEIAHYNAVHQIAHLAAEPTSSGDTLWQKIGHIQESTLTSQFVVTRIANWKTFGLQAIVRLQLPFALMLFLSLGSPYTLVWRVRSHQRQPMIYLGLLVLGVGLLYWNTPYSAAGSDFSPGYLNPMLGYNMRYGFSVLGVMGVLAAVVATGLQLPTNLVLISVLLSAVCGLMSSQIFDVIKNISFTGEQAIWGAHLLDSFKDNPVAGTASLLKLLRSHVSELAILVTVQLVFLGVVFCYLRGIYPDNSALLFRRIRLGFNLVGRRRLSFYPLAGPHWVLWGLLLLVISTSYVSQVRERHQDQLYHGIYKLLETVPPKGKIAYFASHRSYLLYGQHWDKVVLHKPANEQSLTDWVKQIIPEKITLLAAGPIQSLDSRDYQALSALEKLVPLRPKVSPSAITRGLTLYRLRDSLHQGSDIQIEGLFADRGPGGVEFAGNR